MKDENGVAVELDGDKLPSVFGVGIFFFFFLNFFFFILVSDFIGVHKDCWIMMVIERARERF